MNKFIKNIIHFSLHHRYLAFFLTAIIAVVGFIGYENTLIETFPDVTNTQIIYYSHASYYATYLCAGLQPQAQKSKPEIVK